MTAIHPDPEPLHDTQTEPTQRPLKHHSQSPSPETHRQQVDSASSPDIPPQQQSNSEAIEPTRPPQISQHREAARKSAADVWQLKELQWPPDDETRPVIRIITQNENGPCGLIALCELSALKVIA